MIFKPELVEQIRRNCKTETRRPVNDNPRSRWYRERCGLIVGRDYAIRDSRTGPEVDRVEILATWRECWGDIDEAGAIAEGFTGTPDRMAREYFLDYAAALYGRIDLQGEVWAVRFVPVGG